MARRYALLLFVDFSADEDASRWIQRATRESCLKLCSRTPVPDVAHRGFPPARSDPARRAALSWSDDSQKLLTQVRPAPTGILSFGYAHSAVVAISSDGPIVPLPAIQANLFEQPPRLAAHTDSNFEYR